MQRFMRDHYCQRRQSPLVDFDALKKKQDNSNNKVARKRKGQQRTIDDILSKSMAEMTDGQRSMRSKKRVAVKNEAPSKVEQSTMWDSRDAEKSMYLASAKADQATMCYGGKEPKKEKEPLPSPIVGGGMEPKPNILESTRISSVMQIESENVGRESEDISLCSPQISEPAGSFRLDASGTQETEESMDVLCCESTVIRVNHEDVSMRENQGHNSVRSQRNFKATRSSSRCAVPKEQNESMDTLGAENKVIKVKLEDIPFYESMDDDSVIGQQSDLISPTIKRPFKLCIDPHASDKLAAYIQKAAYTSVPSRAAAILDKYFPIKKRSLPTTKAPQTPKEQRSNNEKYGMPVLPRERSARKKSFCEFHVT